MCKIYSVSIKTGTFEEIPFNWEIQGNCLRKYYVVRKIYGQACIWLK